MKITVKVDDIKKKLEKRLASLIKKRDDLKGDSAKRQPIITAARRKAIEAAILALQGHLADPDAAFRPAQSGGTSVVRVCHYGTTLKGKKYAGRIECYLPAGINLKDVDPDQSNGYKIRELNEAISAVRSFLSVAKMSSQSEMEIDTEAGEYYRNRDLFKTLVG